MKSQKLFLFVCTLALCASLSPSAVFATTIDTSETASSSYDLTYPGLLPDHPLYFLKVARDNFMGFFKGEPIEKANFALLQSDKHIAAAYFLMTQKDNAELSYVSLNEAENYIDEAVRQTKSAKQQGADTHDMCQKLKEARKKHAVLFETIIKQKGNNTARINQIKERVENTSSVIANMHP